MALQIFLSLAIALFYQHIGSTGATVVFLSTVKCQYRIQLRQPVYDAAFQYCRLIATGAFTMGN